MGWEKKESRSYHLKFSLSGFWIESWKEKEMRNVDK